MNQWETIAQFGQKKEDIKHINLANTSIAN